MMDLWLNTIYKDERVIGSDMGPVVYFRNAIDDPMTNYSYMTARWGRSKATVCRMLDELGYSGFSLMMISPPKSVSKCKYPFVSIRYAGFSMRL